MSASRFHAGLLEAAARDLDRQLRALTPGETFRAAYLRDHAGQIDAITRAIDAGMPIQGRFARIKQILRKILKPYLSHQARVDRMIVDRIADLTESLNQVHAAIEGLRDEVRDDLDDHAASIRATLRGLGRNTVTAPTTLRMADSNDRLEIPGGARLILGDPSIARPGYLRVDPRDPLADISLPLDAIPARPGTLSEIVVANVLEDYSTSQVRHTLLPHWASLLRPGGRLTLVADDFGAVVDRLRDGQIDPDEFVEAIFGDGDRTRRSALMPEALRRFAEEAGLVDVRISDRAQRSDTRVYGYELTAVAPAA